MDAEVSLTGVPARFAEQVIALIQVPEPHRDAPWHAQYREALARLKRSVSASDPTEDEYERVAGQDGAALMRCLRAWGQDLLHDLPRTGPEA